MLVYPPAVGVTFFTDINSQTIALGSLPGTDLLIFQHYLPEITHLQLPPKGKQAIGVALIP